MIDNVTEINIDDDLREAGRDPQFWADSPRDLWEAMGLELDGVVDGPAPASGPYRRLHATLRSISGRRDGHTRWSASSTPAGFTLRWWSHEGHWGDRSWHVECQVLVELDDHLETQIWVSKVALTVVGSSGGATRYNGWALGPLVRQSVLSLITRDRVRDLAGYWSRRANWLDSPGADSWLARTLEQRKVGANA